MSIPLFFDAFRNEHNLAEKSSNIFDKLVNNFRNGHSLNEVSFV